MRKMGWGGGGGRGGGGRERGGSTNSSAVPVGLAQLLETAKKGKEVKGGGGGDQDLNWEGRHGWERGERRRRRGKWEAGGRGGKEVPRGT